MSEIKSLEICSGPSPDASIIWLHGLGADGYDFAPVVEALQPMPNVRFILPHAPARAITINGGYVMPAWYDILGMDLKERQDEEGIRASQALIETLISQETKRGIAPARIALAGFSQGGAIALHTALRHADKLAGVMALSAYLPLHEKLAAERSANNLAIPIFMAHGRFDDIIPLQTAETSKDFMEGFDYRIEWHEYSMPHSVCNEEIADIRNFISGILQLL